MNRRTFFSAAAAASAAATSLSATTSFAFEETTVAGIHGKIQAGEATSESTVHAFLERIEAIDRSGPALRAIIEVNPDALAAARALDAERKANHIRGPLHGIPVLLKDNIDTAGPMKTTAGSLALVDAPSPRDAFVTARLRAAGAIILGKTNLSEWANFRSTHSTSGWSGRGGQTRNPYALDRNPCGSSSGSGVATSANLCTLAVGTETDGSIVCPSSMNGIVGIKPTVGLVSRSGIIPISATQDTAGPMARNVRDAALLLGSLCGIDPNDPATARSSGKFFADYTQFCNPDGLRGARLGIARQYFNIGPQIDKLMANCLDLMRSAGATIIDPVEFDQVDAWRDSETTVLLYEFKDGLNKYLTARGGPVNSMAACIEFNKQHRAQEMPYFEQELMEMAQAKGSLQEKEYRDALSKDEKLSRRKGIDALCHKHSLDAIVGPTAGPAFLTDLINGDRADSGCASPPAVAGYPHITVPAGHVNGLPIGISFFSTAWKEPRLIALAYAFEQARNARRKPEFLPTALLAG